jgi:predicted phosphodiesterase
VRVRADATRLHDFRELHDQLLITSPQVGASDVTADLVVINGDYAATPVKGILKANLSSSKPIILIAGLPVLDGDNITRRLSEGRRHSRKGGKTRFLERATITVESVRFIGMHKPDTDFILAALDEPHDGATVIITYNGPK